MKTELQVECPEYLEEVRAFAKKRGIEANLEAALEQIVGGGTWFGNPARFRLFKDFAPYSFTWEACIQPKHLTSALGVEIGNWECVCFGGLIYQGPAQPLDGSAPAFCVNIGPYEEGWSIHT